MPRRPASERSFPESPAIQRARQWLRTQDDTNSTTAKQLRQVIRLESQLASKRSTERNQAANELRDHPHPLATDVLMHAVVESKDRSTRFMAASRLAKRPDPRAIEFWVRQTDHPDKLVRSCVGMGLTACDPQVAVEPLVQHLSTVLFPIDSNERLQRTHLQAALKTMRDGLMKSGRLPKMTDHAAYALVQMDPITHPQALHALYTLLEMPPEPDYPHLTRLGALDRAQAIRKLRDKFAQAFPPDEQYPKPSAAELKARKVRRRILNAAWLHKLAETAVDEQGPRPSPRKFRRYPGRK